MARAHAQSRAGRGRGRLHCWLRAEGSGLVLDTQVAIADSSAPVRGVRPKPAWTLACRVAEDLASLHLVQLWGSCLGVRRGQGWEGGPLSPAHGSEAFSPWEPFPHHLRQHQIRSPRKKLCPKGTCLPPGQRAADKPPLA